MNGMRHYFADCLFLVFATLQVLHSFPTRRSSDLRDARVVGNLASQDGQVAHGDRQRIVDLVSGRGREDRKSTRLNSSHITISYAVFCLKKKIRDIGRMVIAA